MIALAQTFANVVDIGHEGHAFNPQCADATATSGWLAMIVVGTQPYNFRDRGRRTTHAYAGVS